MSPNLPPHTSRIAALGLTFFALVGSGCPIDSGNNNTGSTVEPLLPSAELTAVELTRQPSYTQLAAYYCHDLVGGNFAGDIACEAGFGAAPARADLTFGFTTTFELGNENDFPIPLLEMLLGFDIFQGTDQGELGRVCVSFCEDPESPDCAPPADPCAPPDREIDGLEDLVPTVEDLIGLAIDLVEGETPDFSNLAFRYIPAEGATTASVRFELDLDRMLEILEELFVQSTDELLAGQVPTFEIPFKARGSLFFDLPILGRSAVEFGPFEGSWSLAD